jgi:hypothetical protein
MDDVVTDNYQQKINAGAIINNPCSYVRYSVESIGASGGGFHTQDNLGGWNWEGYLTAKQMLVNGRDPRSQVPVPNPDFQVNGKQLCIAAIDNTPYEFGEDAFEIRETLRFLKNPLGSLLKLSKTFHKDVTHHVSTMSRSKAIAKVWLEYRFAFTPLVRSIQDGLEAYSLIAPKEPPRKTARHHEQVSETNSGDVDFDAGGTTISFSCNRIKTLTRRCQILYKVTNPVHDWRWKLGLRNKDIPTTIWQVMPYSFMVDRMFNVSAFVKGVTNLADPNVKILAASVTNKTELADNMMLTAIDSPTFVGSAHGETRIEKYFQYKRDPWSPSYSDTYPKLNIKGLVDDATKVADLVALIINNVR